MKINKNCVEKIYFSFAFILFIFIIFFYFFLLENKLKKFCYCSERRNVRGDDRLYVEPTNSQFNFIKGLYTNKIKRDEEVEVSIDGMRGAVLLADDCVNEGGTLPSPTNLGLPVRGNQVYW